MNIGAIRAQLEHTAAIQLATAGEGLVPQSVRGFAVAFDGGTGVLSLGLLDAQSSQFRAAVVQAGQVAVNLTDPVTFKGLQVKGPLVRLEETSEEAAEAAARYFEAFLGALTGVGFQRTRLLGIFHTGPARWLRMQPLEIYDQTPGPGAGKAL